MEDIKKPLVVITGSSGLIGGRIYDKLKDNYQCVGLDIEKPEKEDAIETFPFDITDSASINEALEQISTQYGKEIASVVHLAAYYDFSGEPSDLYDKVTVQGTHNLLEALKSYDVKQFVFSSTNLVYEPTKPGYKIDEEWPLDPNWDYPESKVKTENVLHKHREHIPVVILRLAGVYDEEGNSIPITHQIQRINEKELTSHFYPGDLLHGNAFIHLNDLVDAFVKTVEHRGQLPEDLEMNISEPETYSYEDLQDVIGEKLHGKEWKTFEIPTPIAKAGSWAQNLVGDPFIKPWMIDRANDHYELDISKAEKLLDWHPKNRLISTLPVMIEGLKSNPKEWYAKNHLN